MENLRAYGRAPFDVAVVHGGPGARGEMVPVARRLSSAMGVLEPLQSAVTLEGQVEELRTVLDEHGRLPLCLVGFSWGAMLSFILAARYPGHVRKLVLVGSGPYEDRYAGGIMSTRLGRLNANDRQQVLALAQMLEDLSCTDRDGVLSRLGTLLSKADSCEPLFDEDEPVECRYDIFRGVWKEAGDLRSSGKLLNMATFIQCPVVAIHGDHDPHPARGVEEPLSRAIRGFRFVLLEKCGHRPWVERYAREEFYRILAEEVSERSRNNGL